MMISDDTKEDLKVQSQIFQSGLEAILSKLDFHSPVTVDYVVAMYLAVGSSSFSDLSKHV